MISRKIILSNQVYPLLALSMLLLVITAFMPEKSRAAISEQEAHAIGVDAYLYFYPLITMDVTRKQSTNVEPGKEIGHGPMNMFVNVPEYPPANMKVVVRPNFDTLYSVAWLDLTKEPWSYLPRHWRSLLSSSDARHVDRCVRISRLAHHWNSSGHLHRRSPLVGDRTSEIASSTSSNSPKTPNGSIPPRLMCGLSVAQRRTAHKTTTRCTKSRPGLRSPRCHGSARDRNRFRSKIDPTVDMKTPPKVQVDTMPAGKLSSPMQPNSLSVTRRMSRTSLS